MEGTVSWHSVTERIVAAARRGGRDPAEITLVAVSKERTPDQIRVLYDLGQRDFGENRAQELSGKVGQLPPDIRWHFIGPLQTNKARLVRPAVSLLHSFDRSALISPWAKGVGYPPPVLIQVKTGDEESKQGVDPAQALALADEVTSAGLEVIGLMTIPPPRAEAARAGFELLAQLGERLRTSHHSAVQLSMGMSDDFEVAIEAGASIVRVGRAIFDNLPD